MRSLVILYTSATVIYFLLGNGSMYWAAVNMITILGFIVVLLNVKFNRTIWTEFATNLTLGRIIYTISCTVSPYEWIYTVNKVFAIVFIIWGIITRIKEIRSNGGQK